MSNNDVDNNNNNYNASVICFIAVTKYPPKHIFEGKVYFGLQLVHSTSWHGRYDGRNRRHLVTLSPGLGSRE